MKRSTSKVRPGRVTITTNCTCRIVGGLSISTAFGCLCSSVNGVKGDGNTDSITFSLKVLCGHRVGS